MAVGLARHCHNVELASLWRLTATAASRGQIPIPVWRTLT
jgi:hypothetical protein